LTFREPEDAAYQRQKAVAEKLKEAYAAAGSVGGPALPTSRWRNR
jgi:hypothetical protein